MDYQSQMKRKTELENDQYVITAPLEVTLMNSKVTSASKDNDVKDGQISKLTAEVAKINMDTASLRTKTNVETAISAQVRRKAEIEADQAVLTSPIELDLLRDKLTMSAKERTFKDKEIDKLNEEIRFLVQKISLYDDREGAEVEQIRAKTLVVNAERELVGSQSSKFAAEKNLADEQRSKITNEKALLDAQSSLSNAQATAEGIKATATTTTANAATTTAAASTTQAEAANAIAVAQVSKYSKESALLEREATGYDDSLKIKKAEFLSNLASFAVNAENAEASQLISDFKTAVNSLV